MLEGDQKCVNGNQLPWGNILMRTFVKRKYFSRFFARIFSNKSKIEEKAEIPFFKFSNLVIHFPTKTTRLFMQRKLRKTTSRKVPCWCKKFSFDIFTLSMAQKFVSRLKNYFFSNMHQNNIRRRFETKR